MPRKKRQGDLVEALFAEVHREAQARRKTDLWADKAGSLRVLLMASQARLERDPGKRIAVRSPRQTGKSTGVMLIVSIRCLETAYSNWVVVGLTRPSVKEIYWSALKQMNEAYELGIVFQHQELTATFKNGSRIRFVGAENIGEIEKLRGGRYDGVVIDECKSFGATVFAELVHDVIEAALMQKAGQLYIIGTPGDTLDGPFYEATAETPIETRDAEGKLLSLSNAPYGSTPSADAKWSLHAWTMEDNTTQFPDGKGGFYTMWDQALIIKARNGWSDDHPTWRREFLGHWVPNDDKRVYRFQRRLHTYVPLSDTPWGLPEGEWKFVLGADLGSRDGTALVVWAFSPVHEGLWEVYADRKEARPGQRMSVSAIAAWIKTLEEEYGAFDGTACDTAGLATMVVDTLAVDHNVYLEPAEKKEKVDHIELFNNDLDRGLIHVRHDSKLIGELIDARWSIAKLEKGRREEDGSIENDIADAALYGFRWCNHKLARKPVQPIALWTPEWHREQARQELADAEKQARARGTREGQLDESWWS